MPFGRLHHLVLMTIIGCAAACSGCDVRREDSGNESGGKPDDGGYHRIVSLAPNITETLYALGCGERVVGVSRFCDHPPEALEKPKVGGYFDPNYEAVAALRPDLVLLLPEQSGAREYLDELGIPHETVKNRTVARILDTIRRIGELCDASMRADSLVTNIETRMRAIAAKTAGRERPAVLISIGRTLGTGTLKDVYIAGKGTHYDELIGLAGGTNAYTGRDIQYPLLSPEGLLHLKPDIIVDLVPGLAETDRDREAVLREWEVVPGVPAVDRSRVHILEGGYTVIPGPRFILLLEDLAEIIHPELFEGR